MLRLAAQLISREAVDVEKLIQLAQKERKKSVLADLANAAFAAEELDLTHFFEEDQVVLRPSRREVRIPIPGHWKKLKLSRLSDADLFLSKLMRNDPIDRMVPITLCAVRV